MRVISTTECGGTDELKEASYTLLQDSCFTHENASSLLSLLAKVNRRMGLDRLLDNKKYTMLSSYHSVNSQPSARHMHKALPEEPDPNQNEQVQLKPGRSGPI